MTDLYFTCEWIIRPAVNYVRLVGIARETGCELAIAEANIVTAEKLVLIRFALRAASQTAFAEFAAKVDDFTGLTDWQPADADTYGRAQILDLALLDTEFIARWMDGMHAYGLHNAGILTMQEASDTHD